MAFGTNEYNLNKLSIKSTTRHQPLQDHSTISEDSKVTLILRNLEERLISYILDADLVIGCVAWLTNEPILNALAKLKGVSLIVQKEDFLRPDFSESGEVIDAFEILSQADEEFRLAFVSSDDWELAYSNLSEAEKSFWIAQYNAIDAELNWTTKLRKLYYQLPYGPPNFAYGPPLSYLALNNDRLLEPVRCVGNFNSSKSPSFPRMHHKFIVFCKIDYFPSNQEVKSDSPLITPYGVWTGSFNFTKNATFSFENALFITDPKIVHAYYSEWNQLEALSEPLDWESEWIKPEWRLNL